MLKTKVIRGLTTAWLEETAERKSQSGQGGAARRPILIFIHGCPDSAETWRAQLDFFQAEGYDVVAPFARGIGDSAAATDPKRYGLEAIALDHLEILREIDPKGVRKIIVVGHDIGGIHAWRLARLLGERLAGLVSVNGPDLSQMAHRLRQPLQVLKSWYIALFQLPLIPEYFLLRWESQLIERAQKKTGMPTDTPVAIAPFLNQYRQAARAIPEVLRGDEALITAPVLVVCSKNDAFLEVPSMEELSRLASDVTVRVIEGDHWVHHHQAARVNALIDRFLEERI